MSTTFTFSAFTESSLLATRSGNGSSLGRGDVIVVPSTATANFSVTDNDNYLSGDSGANERGSDTTGQISTITDAAGNLSNSGRKIYAENARIATDASGNNYLLVQIEQSIDGARSEYHTFYEGVFRGVTYVLPPAGVELTLGGAYNVTDSSSKRLAYDGLAASAATSETTATDDAATYQENETEGAGESLNLLANDGNSENLGLTITQVNGADIGSGAWVDLDKGRVFVSEDGSVDFDAQGDFDALVTGESETVSFEYTTTASDGTTSTATVNFLVEGDGSISTANNDTYTYQASEAKW